MKYLNRVKKGNKQTKTQNWLLKKKKKHTICTYVIIIFVERKKKFFNKKKFESEVKGNL